MKDHAGVAGKMFSVLSKHNINIQMINTSEIKISVVIDEKFTELALRALHDAFELGRDAAGDRGLARLEPRVPETHGARALVWGASPAPRSAFSLRAGRAGPARARRRHHAGVGCDVARPRPRALCLPAHAARAARGARPAGAVERAGPAELEAHLGARPVRAARDCGASASAAGRS